MLRLLPQRQRAALLLTEIFDYSSEQAAKILGIRPTTVRALDSQGRAAPGLWSSSPREIWPGS